MREALADHAWPVYLVCLGVGFAHVWVVDELGLPDRLAAWWVPRAQRRGRWAGPWSAAISSLALIALVVVLMVAHLPGGTMPWWWPWLVVTVALALYLPFFVTTAPYVSGYWRWRERLRQQGADDRLQRRVSWWAGPPSFAGFWVISWWALTLLSRAGS
ncbi:hypothetical protein [Nocardioides solisilvae]|uniref:hypothetical protein n=1 Tax=Nocardioides solisilvae TaxID=1542435 RepID=UPI000D74DAB4|nr:hypothetical protein [Nocardioides solisilvae]